LLVLDFMKMITRKKFEKSEINLDFAMANMV
jgi:hypothetical protein